MKGNSAEDPVRRDDELLDALRHGTSPPAEDPVATLLAGWHTEIEAHAARLDAAAWPAVDGAAGQDPINPGPDPAAVRLDHTETGPSPVPPITVSRPAAADTDPVPAALRSAASTGNGARRERPAGRTPRRTQALSGAILTLVVATGGIWLGSARAEPGGLLWPVTELAWAERAESLVAEREIDRLLDHARRDLGAGRYAEARHDLEQAAALLVHLGDGRRAARLRIDIDDLRQRLPDGDVADTSPGGTAPAAPGGTDVQQSLPAPPGTPPAPPQRRAPVSPTAAAPAPDTVPPARPAPSRPLRVPAAGGHAPTPGGGPDARHPAATRPSRTDPGRPAAAPAAAHPATTGRPARTAPASGTGSGPPTARTTGRPDPTAPASGTESGPPTARTPDHPVPPTGPPAVAGVPRASGRPGG